MTARFALNGLINIKKAKRRFKIKPSCSVRHLEILIRIGRSELLELLNIMNYAILKILNVILVINSL